MGKSGFTYQRVGDTKVDLAMQQVSQAFARVDQTTPPNVVQVNQATYTAIGNEDMIVANQTCKIMLPTPTAGWAVTVVQGAKANSVTVTTASATVALDGSTPGSVTLSEVAASAQIVTDGTAYYVVGSQAAPAPAPSPVPPGPPFGPPVGPPGQPSIPTGPAGGDLTGTYPNPLVGPNKVTYAKIQTETASTLLGNPTGSTANVREITLDPTGSLAFVGSTILAGKLLVNSSDGTADYLAAKLTATAPIALTAIPGGTSPPSTGLKLWLRSDAGVSLSGSNVTAWADQSGNANNFSQATGSAQPTLTAGAINGLPAIAFNGSSQWLSSAFSISGPKHIVIVRKLAAVPASFQFFVPFEFQGPAHASTLSLWTGNVSFQPASWRHDVTASAAGVGVATALDTLWHAEEQSYNGGANTSPSSYVVDLDGTAGTVVASGNFPANASIAISSLGAQVSGASSPASFYDGSIAEILVYDHVLSAGDIAVVRGYLQNKYAITIAGAAAGESTYNAALLYDNASLTLNGSNQLQRAALTGDVTASAGSNSTTISGHAVSGAKFRQSVANTLVGNPTGSLADVVDIPLNAPLFFSGGNLILDIDGSSLQLSGGTTLIRAALTGDVTASAASNTTSLINIPNDVTMAGDLLATAIAAPSTPASGKARIYVDSTSLNLATKNASGIVNHGIQSNAGTAHQWVSAIADNGAVTLTQPSYADISGSVPAITQLTGDVLAGPGSGSVAASFRSFTGLSVLARAAGTSGTPTELTATANNQVLQELGGVLAFHTLDYSQLTGTPPDAGKVLVDSTDATADYLGNKITATTPIVATVVPGASAPPATGLKLWLRADAGVTLSGSNVTNWADQSGNGNNWSQATGSAQPTLTTGAINGLPAVTFNGTSQWLSSAFSISGAKHIVIVRKLTSVPGTSDFFAPWNFQGPGSEQSFEFYTGSISYKPYSWRHDVTATANGVGAATALDTSWHAEDQRYNGGTNTSTSSYGMNVDGTASTVIATGSFGVHTSITLSSLGCQLASGNVPASFFNGSIAAVFVYDHVLSGTDQAALYSYLQGKYAITIAGAGGTEDTLNISHAASGVTAGTYATAGSGFITVDADGHVTTAHTGFAYDTIQINGTSLTPVQEALNFSSAFTGSTTLGTSTNIGLAASSGDVSGTYPALTIPTKGQVFVNSTDASGGTPDYLTNKIISQTGTVALAAISGNALLSLDVAQETIHYFMDIASWPVNQGWIATSEPATFYNGVAIEYPVQHAAKTVTLVANLIANGLTTSGVTAVVTQNGSSVIGAVVNFSTTTTPGRYSSGPITVSGSAATDTYGLKWTNSATGSVKCAFTVFVN